MTRIKIDFWDDQLLQEPIQHDGTAFFVPTGLGMNIFSKQFFSLKKSVLGGALHMHWDACSNLVINSPPHDEPDNLWSVLSKAPRRKKIFQKIQSVPLPLIANHPSNAWVTLESSGFYDNLPPMLPPATPIYCQASFTLGVPSNTFLPIGDSIHHFDCDNCDFQSNSFSWETSFYKYSWSSPPVQV